MLIVDLFFNYVISDKCHNCYRKEVKIGSKKMPYLDRKRLTEIILLKSLNQRANDLFYFQIWEIHFGLGIKTQ
jgi:hypothetical protein